MHWTFLEQMCRCEDAKGHTWGWFSMRYRLKISIFLEEINGFQKKGLISNQEVTLQQPQHFAKWDFPSSHLQLLDILINKKPNSESPQTVAPTNQSTNPPGGEIPTGFGVIFGSFSPGSDVWQLSLGANRMLHRFQKATNKCIDSICSSILWLPVKKPEKWWKFFAPQNAFRHFRKFRVVLQIPTYINALCGWGCH